MSILHQSWWKIVAVGLLLYTIIGGLLLPVPHLPILHETIRVLYFHVPMWFGMIILFTISLVQSIRYLRNPRFLYDTVAVEMTNAGILMGILGLLTGSLWAKFTWGDWWTNDPKLNSAAVAMLIYLAYSILRGSLEDPQQRARISAIYNIFAYAVMIPLLFILPRLKGADSLHPGNGGNPGFNIYDQAKHLRLIFYPAVAGWTLAGVWMASLRIRLRVLEHTLEEKVTATK